MKKPTKFWRQPFELDERPSLQRYRRRRITPALDTKPLNVIRSILEANNLPQEEIEEHMARVKAERLRRRSTNRKQAMSVAAWRYLRTPLHAELRNAFTCLKYRDWSINDTDLVRREAYTAYLAVLEKLTDKFTEYVNLYPDMTPLQVLKELQSKGKLTWVQDGNHWADWVPDRIKAPIMQAFGEIPYRKQAKRKIPFERTVPKGHNDGKRGLLVKSIEAEIATRVAQLESGGDEHLLLAKIQLLQVAQARLNRKRDSSPLPNTWHALVTDAELKAARETRPPKKVVDLEETKRIVFAQINKKA